MTSRPVQVHYQLANGAQAAPLVPNGRLDALVQALVANPDVVLVQARVGAGPSWTNIVVAP